ncbi:hypothetical protein H0H92_006649 [Tricholoma furcatifolium]|nr:hypothetical protein H0H92_006649 [Tricholoma furcatifolium]
MEVAEGWSIRDTVDVPSVQTISTKMALLIIAKCGFGFPVDWSAPPTDPDGTMSIQEALRVVADSYIISLMAPDWVRSLPIPGFAKVRKAVHAFTAFMSREVEVRRQEVRDGSETSEERVDAFTMLVRANEQETGKRRLTDQEVIGNVFILLFAGHETTAHTMSTALMLLAVHDDIQSEVFEQIQEVVGDGRDVDLVYSDHEKLNKISHWSSVAPAHLMIREATEDTVLNLPNPVGEEGSTPIAVQKGTNIILDMIGTQRNPRYFSDPEVFKPSRWYDVSGESEAFAGFSLGPRACIGRKFAVVEAVAFLTMLLRDWHVTPILEAGETPQVWKERFLSKPILGLTMSLRGAPLNNFYLAEAVWHEASVVDVALRSEEAKGWPHLRAPSRASTNLWQFRVPSCPRFGGILVDDVFGSGAILVNISYLRCETKAFSLPIAQQWVPTIVSSNFDVMRQVLMSEEKIIWQKPEQFVTALGKWGRNVIASLDGEEWRRHRRIIGRAFTGNRLYQMVWVETLKTYNQMETVEGWETRNELVIPAVHQHSSKVGTISVHVEYPHSPRSFDCDHKMALLVIAKCGFGFPFDWATPPTSPDGKMTIQEALRTIIDSHVISLMVPKWVFKNPLRYRFFYCFYGKAEVRSEIHGINERRNDVFTMLVRANEGEQGKWKLEDQELFGNVFIMLFAGHETTALGISAALALLSLHQDIQNEVAEQIMAIVGDGREPTICQAYESFELLNKVLATFYEALRLFPPGYLISRNASQDTLLSLPNPLGQEGSQPLTVLKGTNVIIDIVGIHYSPRYFPDPEAFKPERWYGLSPFDHEALPAFSLGHRVCVGQKFATVEAVAFLTMFLRDWRIEPGMDVGETLDTWRERTLSPELGVTLGLKQVSLKLTRRRKLHVT